MTTHLIPSIRSITFASGFVWMLIGCAGPEDVDAIGSTRSPILSGTPTSARPEVGIFSELCTATIIAHRYFLTAAHCIDYTGLRRGGSFKIEGHSSIGVTRTFSLGNNKVGSHDLAVGELLSAIPSWVTPAVIATSTPGYGTWLTGMGYGCNTGTSGWGVKRYREFIRTGEEDIGCYGDSGGPHFVGRLNENGPIGLVVSGRIGDHDVHADPPLHRNEIFGLIASLSNSGVCYRGHIANSGWIAPTCNGGTMAGPNFADDQQAAQIWTARPGVSICYRAHVHNIGWQPEICDADMTGTTGRSLNIQALQIRLAARPGGERLMAQAYVAGVGWQNGVEVTNGGQVGVTGRGMRAFRLWFL